MRLSQNVKRNQLQEENKYSQPNGEDVKVERNQVMDFEEKQYERGPEVQVDENKENEHGPDQIKEPRDPAEEPESKLMFASEASNSNIAINPVPRNDNLPVEFINFTTTIQNKNIQIENLVITVHDTSVKPIIGNKEIEP
mmetsp:Transcript_45329/g.38179  ORF Transcript_45329/g.38179 Transcript_45329/m.38179 type:complete len:140 (+) Transcript_45329:861-1280(+)